MAVLMYIVLFLALTGYSNLCELNWVFFFFWGGGFKGATYCICKDGLSDTALQKTLDYACGAGADCSAILQNGGCYNPNSVKDHCSYAVNSYFQKKNQSGGTCDFSGTATTSASPPSDIASTCTFPSSATRFDS
ncbi:X8 domain [Dillenia turbinata]|uniref:X8 domain n=1 Tax=Dillenia turbinata TaxID=194707 RepID=A0AAN8UZ64_9MAGN